jgi:O-antigen ligase
LSVARDWLLRALAVGLAASITLAETVLVLLAVVLVLGPRAARPRAAWPLIGPLIAFALWTLVSALASGHVGESLLASRGLLTLAAFYVVLNALPDGRAAGRFASGLLIAVGIVALLSIVQVGFCPPDGTLESGVTPVRLLMRKCARARGFFSIYMTLAGVLTLVLVSALPRVALGGRTSAWTVPAWLAGILALGLTSVRGAWLGFAAGCAVCALGIRGRRLVGAALVVVVAGALVVEPRLLDRVKSIGNLADDTTRDRLAMLHAGLGLAFAHPLTGIGPGQVKRVYPTVAPPEALRRSTSHLHNTPLQIVVERGLPGLAAWIAIWVGFFGAAWRVFRRVPPADAEARALVLGSMAAVAAFLVGGLFEYNFGDTEVLLAALAVMALPFVVERDLSGSPSSAGDGRDRSGRGPARASRPGSGPAPSSP